MGRWCLQWMEELVSRGSRPQYGLRGEAERVGLYVSRDILSGIAVYPDDHSPWQRDLSSGHLGRCRQEALRTETG